MIWKSCKDRQYVKFLFLNLAPSQGEDGSVHLKPLVWPMLPDEAFACYMVGEKQRAGRKHHV